ncbi:hypothetical protein RHMOL_Rhmol02G0129700 [Rhododendron molle]|uniref:Uncharacterized protein n=1 Tax=Rhododendron molle TaxID=49168 RepID=A0ACC0PQV0_RHOML|nr:hypothetical protein RHMOL_Rhmol02G0129700 [Rhododendron molle]
MTYFSSGDAEDYEVGDADKVAARVVVDGKEEVAQRPLGEGPSTERPSGEAAMWVTLEEWNGGIVVEDLTGWNLK